MEINRLTITTESRILGDEYVRFGGEYIETCFHKGKKGALCLAIGVALGRSITVLPLLPDGDPYGFLGEYQGVKIKGIYPNEVAKEIFNILCDNPNTRSKYLSCLTGLLLSSSNKEDACKWLKLIEQIPNTDIDFWKYVQSHTNENEVLVDPEILKKLNGLFLHYNIPQIVRYIATITDVNDLPF